MKIFREVLVGLQRARLKMSGTGVAMEGQRLDDSLRNENHDSLVLNSLVQDGEGIIGDKFFLG